MKEHDFGRKVTQEQFGITPAFEDLKILGIAKDGFKISNPKEVRKERVPNFTTSVSDIEVLLPLFLAREGLLESSLNKKEQGSLFNESSVVGTHLHKIDSLLSIKAQETYVDKVFPTHIKPSEKKAFEMALDDSLSFSRSNPEEMITTLSKVCDKFRKYYLTDVVGETWQDALFPNEKSKQQEELEIVSDPSTKRLEDHLIADWVKELISPNPMSWEFEKDILTQREVTIIVHVEKFKLQLRGRLDSIVRKDVGKGSVRSQIIDFKTGSGVKGDTLTQEIGKRQILMMRMMSEWFTAVWFTGKRSLKETTSAYIFNNYEGNTATIDRLDLFAYRRFNKQTGQMILEPAPMELEARLRMEKWLEWYSQQIHENENEIRKILKRRVQFDTNRVKLKNVNYI